MATLKKRTLRSNSRARSADESPIVLDLACVVDGPRPGPANPAADRAWLALRRELFSALTGSPFDPRKCPAFDGPLIAAWKADRLAWLRERFQGDPRLT
jgi:hypothetical protein